MTEEESRKAIFELNQEYMSHTKEERLKLYDEYIKKRAEIREKLSKNAKEKKLKLK